MSSRTRGAKKGKSADKNTDKGQGGNESDPESIPELIEVDAEAINAKMDSLVDQFEKLQERQEASMQAQRDQFSILTQELSTQVTAALTAMNEAEPAMVQQLEKLKKDVGKISSEARFDEIGQSYLADLKEKLSSSIRKDKKAENILDTCKNLV